MGIPRRVEREQILGLLYEAEVKGLLVDDVLHDQVVPPTPFVRERCAGVASMVDELDGVLTRHIKNWEFDRVALLDRIVLRIGVWELRHDETLPTPIIISEAVELAKRFSTDDSGAFVNGVLASAANEVRTAN